MNSIDHYSSGDRLQLLNNVQDMGFNYDKGTLGVVVEVWNNSTLLMKIKIVDSYHIINVKFIDIKII